MEAGPNWLKMLTAIVDYYMREVNKKRAWFHDCMVFSRDALAVEEEDVARPK